MPSPLLSSSDSRSVEAPNLARPSPEGDGSAERMDDGLRIGIDLGGTKIAAVVLDRTGAERFAERMPTPAGDYAATIERVAALVRACEARCGGPAPVGIGTPGAVSLATGRMKNANSTVLNDRPLRADLETAIGRAIRLANDANCFAISEATDGAAAGAEVVFGAILGTGVGGGIVVRGRSLGGANAIAGEWGHTPLPWPRDDERPGPPCYCGRSGCIETWLSGPAFAAEFGRVARRDLTPHAIAAAAAVGDVEAIAALARYVDRLARGLAVVCDVLDPDVVVVGGGMSNVGAILRDLPAALGRCVFSDTFATPLLPARFGDASGVRGAARLWPSDP